MSHRAKRVRQSLHYGGVWMVIDDQSNHLSISTRNRNYNYWTILPDAPLSVIHPSMEILVNVMRLARVGFLLAQRLRRWANIRPIYLASPVFTGKVGVEPWKHSTGGGGRLCCFRTIVVDSGSTIKQYWRSSISYVQLTRILIVETQ